MRFNPIRWLHYTLVAVAVVGSLVSLFALFELGAPSWITPLNILLVLCILLAAKTRDSGGTSANDH